MIGTFTAKVTLETRAPLPDNHGIYGDADGCLEPLGSNLYRAHLRYTSDTMSEATVVKPRIIALLTEHGLPTECLIVAVTVHRVRPNDDEPDDDFSGMNHAPLDEG